MKLKPRAIAALGAVALAAFAAVLVVPDGDDAAEVAVAESEPAAADAPEAERSSAAPELVLDPPKDAHPLIWVRSGKRVGIHAEPGGEMVEAVDRRTEFGSPTVFGVVRRDGDWVGVSTPSLPNDQLGWIRLDARRLDAGWTKLSIVVDLSELRAELRAPGRVVRSFAVSIGRPEAPTPTGRFAVTDTFRGGLNPAYGCCALALSANQPDGRSG